MGGYSHSARLPVRQEHGGVMAPRFIQSEYDRQQIVRFIEQQKLPFSVSVERGRKRSLDQNRLQRQWQREISEQLGDRTPEEVRGHCKLHHGVPIMRHASDGFRETYDRVIRPLPYEQKLALMMAPLDMPVTRLMNTRQHTEYLDAIHREFTQMGLVLTDPSGLIGEPA